MRENLQPNIEPYRDSEAEKDIRFIKKDECPVCLHLIDCASPTKDIKDEHRPGPGDFSLCVYCAAFLRFDEKMILYSPSEDEVIEADMLDQLTGMRKKVLEFKKEFPELFK